MNDTMTLLVKKYQEEILSNTSMIASGRIADHEEYKRLCGVIQGFARATEIVEELAKQLEIADE